MPIHVALLRGINVVGRNVVAMSDLRDLFEALGFDGVQSLLQSGNVVFDGAKTTGAPLESLLEVETSRRLNVSVDYVVRRASEWQKVVARNPFADEARRDPSHLLVMFLKAAPEAKDVKAL